MDINIAGDPKSIKKMIFKLSYATFDVFNPLFFRAEVIDLYNNDIEFVTIDYYNGGKVEQTQIIRKSNIDTIEIVWNS